MNPPTRTRLTPILRVVAIMRMDITRIHMVEDDRGRELKGPRGMAEQSSTSWRRSQSRMHMRSRLGRRKGRERLHDLFSSIFFRLVGAHFSIL